MDKDLPIGSTMRKALSICLAASAIEDLATRVLSGVNGGTKVPADERGLCRTIIIAARYYPHQLADESSWRK
jgi:hypothetical protein